MSSFTHSGFMTKEHVKEIAHPILFLLLVSPVVAFFELWALTQLKSLKQPTREFNQYAARLSLVNLQLLRNPSVRMVRVGVPTDIHAMGTMLAVSRNAKGFLLANKVSFIDPVTLSSKSREQLRTPFDLSRINNYILIEDIRHYGRSS